MNKLYFNKVTKEFGVSFETLKRKYPNISLSNNIDKIEDWIGYDQVVKPHTHLYQDVIEILPVFTEVKDKETNEITLTNGLQKWKVTNKEVTGDFLLSIKKEIKDKITNKRWEVEGSGITFPNGISVKTSKDDQDRILSVIINAERNGIEEIDFKAESGWVKISLVALKQLGKELTNFVQFCFRTEKNHHEAIDALAEIEQVCSYNYNANWVFSILPIDSSVVNIHDMSIETATVLLYSNFIFPKNENNKLLVGTDRKEDAQSILDKAYYKVKDLDPNQFYFLLAKSGLDDAIKVLLPPLRLENISKYSQYKSYLYGARFYEFSKAYSMYEDIKPKILNIDSTLNYTIEELKTLWKEAGEFK